MSAPLAVDPPSGGPGTDRPAPTMVSVIIPVHDGAATIAGQLEALGRQTYRGPTEVVVVDNRSTDGTGAVVEGFAGRLDGLRLIDAAARPGSSHARNVGAAAARGDFLAFCDADDEVDEGWLAALTAAAPHADLVGGVQDAERLNDATVRAGRAPRSTEALTVALGFLPFAPTSNLGVWADVYASLGGLRDSYPQAHDVELSWRAQLAGYRLGFAPDAVVHYRYRSTWRGVARQAHWSAFDAAQLFHDYRSFGVPPPSPSAAVRRLAWLAARSPWLVTGRRALWARQAGTATGHLAGSVRFGVRYL